MTAPFSVDDTDILSIRRRVPYLPPARRNFYLGRAGNMIQLPSPTVGYDATPNQGEGVASTLSGAQSVTRLHPAKAKWQLNWVRMGGRDWQIVNGFYRRLFGAGPWFLVSPEDVNRLPDGASLFTDLSGWAVTVGTFVIDASASPVVPSGVARWAGAGATSLLTFGTVPSSVPTPNPLTGPPYVPPEPVTASLYVRTVSGTASVKLRVSGRAANGTLSAEYDSGAQTVTATGWTRLTVTVGPGDLTSAAFVLPVLACLTAAAPNILVAAAQVEHAGSVSDWSVGGGSPRVTCSGLTRAVDDSLRNTVSLMLGQV